MERKTWKIAENEKNDAFNINLIKKWTVNYSVSLRRMKMSNTLSHTNGESWKTYSDKIEKSERETPQVEVILIQI